MNPSRSAVVAPLGANPYLILHKVRGAATFDVAERLQIGAELGWIIPTSGHRAYPYRWWLLEDLADTSDINSDGYHQRPYDLLEGHIPDHHPDHYPRPVNKRTESFTPMYSPEQLHDILSELHLDKDPHP